MLFGVRTTDPVTYIAVGVLLAAIAFVACQVPAARAARINPLRTLRAE
jgi:putative ABC transport system permease protein